MNTLKMIYSFDWGGTLNENPALMEIAQVLLQTGYEVHIISVAWPEEKRLIHLKEIEGKLGFRFTGIHIIEETGTTQHGKEKVKIMNNIGSTIIFDDNQDVINHAKVAGFLALKVPYKDH